MITTIQVQLNATYVVNVFNIGDVSTIIIDDKQSKQSWMMNNQISS